MSEHNEEDEEARWATCRCIIRLGAVEKRCHSAVPIDAPFCPACETRHPDMPEFDLLSGMPFILTAAPLEAHR